MQLASTLRRGQNRLVLGGVLLALLAMVVTPAFAQVPEKPRDFSPNSLDRIEPQWGNPWLSFLPAEANPNWAYWRGRMLNQATERAANLPNVVATTFNETEGNDTIATANHVTSFNTEGQIADAVNLAGNMPAAPAPAIAAEAVEDNGAIPLAQNLALTPGNAIFLSGFLGDGPHGSLGTASGDFDFFEFTGLTAGQVLLVDVDTPLPFFGDLDPFAAIYDAAGTLLAFNDDDGATFDSLVSFTVPADGDYYVSLGSYGNPTLTDPFDSSTGTGFYSEGTYDITFGLDYVGDIDNYSFDLFAGDIVGVTCPQVQCTLFAPDGTQLMGSGQDASGIYPAESPLPGGDNAVLNLVAGQSGTYTLQATDIAAFPNYTIQLRGFRPVLQDAAPGTVHYLFLDFDGETNFAADVFFGGNADATISPLSAFLAGWGLGPDDEDAVIDAIVAETERAMRADTEAINPWMRLEVLNSRDHADPFGEPNVSRVVVGGTIPELGIGTLGIAETIDPGNFSTGDTAIVLLDLLSDPDTTNPNSLNSFMRDPGASVIDIIGIGVGRIVAHEAGHFIGSWHTEQFTTPPNIMDQGGNLPGLIGVGPDNIFGTADDLVVNFITDVFNPNEGFTGLEDTTAVTGFGLKGPQALPTDIPTVSEIGLGLLGLLLAGLGFVALRRRGA